MYIVLTFTLLDLFSTTDVVFTTEDAAQDGFKACY